MKKILIAIDDSFLVNLYKDVFKEKGFTVLTLKENEEIFPFISNNSSDIILLDVVFAERNNFELLEKIKNDDSLKRIPIILYSKIKEDGYREKAIEYELKDFIVGTNKSPLDILNKVKIHLSIEKSYKMPVDVSLETIKSLANDLGYESLACSKCSNPLKIYLIRDLQKGHNYFKLSFICDNC